MLPARCCLTGTIAAVREPVSLQIRTWNIAHGRDVPPDRAHGHVRRKLLPEMAKLMVEDAPDVILLQEVPVWAGNLLREGSGLQAFGDVAAPPRIGPFPSTAELGRLLTSIHHGFLRSAFSGQANALLVAPGLRVLAHERIVLNAKRFRDAQARVLRALSPLLFRGDQDSGQGDEIAAFLLARRDAAARVFDKDTVWRLLQAQATAAQRVGAGLLAVRDANEFSVRQWARLGAHSDLSVRQFAMRAFEAHEGAIKQHARDALRLLDTSWDDAREFGFRYFRERFSEADWSPEYIVGVCDSTNAEVQSFGREILQRFFQQSQGPHYLATLSEHPSINVQLFVTNFLEHHAGGQRDRILALRDYFVSVLSKVNKARAAKDRVLAFLLRESLKDDAVATMVADIFTRVSLTIVRRDRSDLIRAMIAMQAAFPHLQVPIRAVPVRKSNERSAGGV